MCSSWITSAIRPGHDLRCAGRSRTVRNDDPIERAIPLLVTTDMNAASSPSGSTTNELSTGTVASVPAAIGPTSADVAVAAPALFVPDNPNGNHVVEISRGQAQGRRDRTHDISASPLPLHRQSRRRDARPVPVLADTVSPTFGGLAPPVTVGATVLTGATPTIGPASRLIAVASPNGLIAVTAPATKFVTSSSAKA